ncbi:hypothetical protein Tco_1022504 [Tanacetum coccineum]
MVNTYSGANNADYLQRAITDYHVEYGVPSLLPHCWDVLKERINANRMKKFHLREGSINFNTTIGDEEENEVEEVRRPKPMGRDQAKRKMKAALESSTSSFDVEALAKMMANSM